VTHPRGSKYALAALALAAVLALAWIARRLVELSSDSIFAVAWGSELAEGRLPEFSGDDLPVKHPLAIGLGVVVAPLTPQGSIDAYSMLALLAFLAVLYATFRLGRAVAGVAAGALAAVLVAAHPYVESTALRGLTDGLFAALALLAAALAIESGTRRWRAVLSLLAVAGLLRPEAWALALPYGIWVASRSDSWRRRIVIGAFVLAAPALWLAADAALTGDPWHTIRNPPTLRSEAVGGGLNQVIPPRGDQPTSHLPGGEIASGIAIGIHWPQELAGALIHYPLELAGALIAAWALWSGRRILLSGLREERLEGESASRWPSVLLSLAVLSMTAALAFLRLFEFRLSPRFLFAPAIALIVLAVAAPWLIRRSPVSVALGVILAPLVVAGTIGGLARFPGLISTQSEGRAQLQDLVALLEAPAVREAVIHCPRLVVSSKVGRLDDVGGGRHVMTVNYGQALASAALVLGLDPADIEVTDPAGYDVPPGGSFISDDPSRHPAPPAARRMEGDWVFTSACSL
jgi:hypothetical protein